MLLFQITRSAFFILSSLVICAWIRREASSADRLFLAMRRALRRGGGREGGREGGVSRLGVDPPGGIVGRKAVPGHEAGSEGRKREGGREGRRRGRDEF